MRIRITYLLYAGIYISLIGIYLMYTGTGIWFRYDAIIWLVLVVNKQLLDLNFRLDLKHLLFSS